MTDEQRRDARLVHRILSGDETAFAELNALYKHRICKFIASKIGDWHYAEELTQDTFLKVNQHLQTLREPEKVLNWMLRIANQLVAGWHRKNQKRIQMESFADVAVTDMESAAANAYQLAETDTLDKDRYISLFEAIAQLPELEQKIFRLRLENKSYEEIAETCEVTVSIVRNRLSRAKTEVKTLGSSLGRSERRRVRPGFFRVQRGKG